MIWIAVISLALLSLIALYDIKYRLVPVICMAGEAVASFVLGYNYLGITLVRSVIINISIVLFQMFLLWGWFRMKEGSSEVNLWLKFGPADFFMLAIAAINFSALNYLLFTVLVSIISIIFWMTITSIKKVQDKTIPFAGFLAIGIIIFRIIKLTGYGANSYSDNYIMNVIYGTL